MTDVSAGSTAAPEPRPMARPVAMMLPVSAVAQHLGIAAPTLRTWERRYGLRPTIRTPGGHRRYSAGDVARLERMHRLMERGVPPGQAAVASLAAVRHPGDLGGTSSATAAGVRPAATQPIDAGTVGDRRAVIRGMLLAAKHLDGEALDETVAEQLHARGLINGWDDIVGPALIAIGDAWALGKLGVESEHLASECISSQLRSWSSRRQDNPVSTRPVLLACAEREHHGLPLLAVAAALAERRIPVKLLGAMVPTVALGAAMRRSGPSATFVWSSQVATGDPLPYLHLSARRRSPVLVLGGPGWQRDGIGRVRKVRTADTLAGAVDLLAAIARP